MYHVSAQGVDEHMINVHYYYYDTWQNFSEAEFHIFLCTMIEIIIIYYFQGCE